MLKTPSVRSPLSSNRSLPKKKKKNKSREICLPSVRLNPLSQSTAPFSSEPTTSLDGGRPLDLRPFSYRSSLSRPFHHLRRCLHACPFGLPSIRLDPSQPTAPGPARSEPDLDPILPSFRPETMPEFVNSRGQPATRSTTGVWPSVLFIIGTNLELCFCFRRGQWAGRGVRGGRRGGGSHGDGGGGGRRQRRSKVGGGGDGERGGVSEESGARRRKKKGKKTKRGERMEWKEFLTF